MLHQKGKWDFAHVDTLDSKQATLTTNIDSTSLQNYIICTIMLEIASTKSKRVLTVP